MGGAVFVVNAGSSTIKYRLIEADTGATVCSGLVERIGTAGSHLVHRHGAVIVERDAAVADHDDAMRRAVACFDEVGPDLSTSHVVAVGHRVVMGGGAYDGPVLITDDVVANVERLVWLAPLHNPAHLAAIRAGRDLFPDVPHVAVFDTAFFHDLPAAAATYALDRHVAERFGVRRYGFHGISHHYVSTVAAELLGRDLGELRQIVLHLGNGASASAIVGGRPVDTSMGLTPLEGLVMGTRTGDIDPAVVFHLVRSGMEIDDVEHLFNRRSGMAGLTGAGDMRDVHRLIAAGDGQARLGLDVYVRRVKKYLGAYAAVMGGLDAVTFTAGVGENDAVVRAEICAGLDVLGIRLDAERNAQRSTGPRIISPDGAPVSVLVVPTDEELAIARQAITIL